MIFSAFYSAFPQRFLEKTQIKIVVYVSLPDSFRVSDRWKTGIPSGIHDVYHCFFPAVWETDNHVLLKIKAGISFVAVQALFIRFLYLPHHNRHPGTALSVYGCVGIDRRATVNQFPVI